MDVKQYVEDVLDITIYCQNQKVVLHDAQDQKASLTQDEVAQLCEQLLEMAELGWQPIETAPKDGSMIIAFNAKAQHSEIELGVYDGRKWRSNDRYWEEIKPTHWRPLPQAPKVKP